jgi:hypothetical protein
MGLLAWYLPTLMRKLLRNLHWLTLSALAAVLIALVVGDRVFKRTAPAVRLVYDVQSPGSVPVSPAEMAAALKVRVDPGDVHEISFRAVPTRHASK